jgi:3-methyl-2-oxobutanoate hydroxymethyltransferase
LQSDLVDAGRLVKEANAQAVKIEITESSLGAARQIFEAGIPVMGHVGFTPQSVLQMGYKVQRDEAKILALAKAAEKAGCFAIVLELMPSDLAKKISETLTIPTIGIGAGPHCDGQVLVVNDVLGLTEKPAKFVKKYVDLRATMLSAVSEFKRDVESGRFPDREHSYE